MDINDLHTINKDKGYREGDKVIKLVSNQLKLIFKKYQKY